MNRFFALLALIASLATESTPAQQSTTNTKDSTYYIAQQVRTSKGKLPPCSPLKVVEDRGKKFKMRMASGLGHSFSVSKKQLEVDRHASFEACLQSAELEQSPEALLSPMREQRLSIGDPIASAEMILGRAGDVGDSNGRTSRLHGWEFRVPSRDDAARFIGGHSFNWDRLKNACQLRVGVDRDGAITTISMLECWPISLGYPTSEIASMDVEQRSGVAVAAYRDGSTEKAFDIWLALAETGHAPSQFRVGALLYNREIEPRGSDDAITWLTKAAEQLYTPATYRLGLLYMDGDGVDQDLVTAYRHLSMAAWANYKDARKRIGELETTLTEEQIAEATSSDHADQISNPTRIDTSAAAAAYPVAARVERTSGEVWVRAHIGKDGTVDDLVVLSCNNPGFGFEFAALDSIAQWRYEPAMRNGEPAAIYFTVSVNFDIH